MKPKHKDIRDYVVRIENHLRKKYPGLEFDVNVRSDNDAVIYFRGVSSEDEYAVIKRAGPISTDALIQCGYRIYTLPAPEASLTTT
jgi:hypothetical protein